MPNDKNKETSGESTRAESEKVQGSKKPMLKKILIIAGVVVLVLGAGVGGLLIGKSGSDTPAAGLSADAEIVQDVAGTEPEAVASAGNAAATAPGAPAAENAAGTMEPDLNVEMREITTNLNDPTGRQFVKIRIQLEASTTESRAQIERNEAPLRDAALFLLSGKTQAEIQPPAARERLKRELLARFNGLLEPNAVRNLYFTELIVQRI